MPKSDLSDSESERDVLPEEQSKLKNGFSSKNEQKLPEYEVQRRKRIEENNKKMEALGLKKISTSFMGSIDKAQKKMIEKKGKKKVIDEDEEYNPTEDNEEMDSASEEEKDHGDFSKSLKKKVKKNTPTPKKRGPAKKLWIDDYADDDDTALMQAIALSLKDSAGFLNLEKENNSTEQNANSEHSNSVTTSKSPMDTSSQIEKEGARVQDNSRKEKRKKPSTSRVQMSEDEMLIHFFQFDEIGKGGISVRDIERLAITHDFTWTEKEIADMVYCFDSDGDRKISYDDFRKIVGRCNMLKTSDNDATGRG